MLKYITPTYLLHHANTPSHTYLCIPEYQAKHKAVMLQQPPYSPDLAQSNFLIFARIKTTLKGCRFESIHVIQAAVTKILNYVIAEAFEGVCWA